MVGWSIGERMTGDLVLAALNIALAQRKRDDVIHHSDQGAQPAFNWSSQHALRMRHGIRRRGGVKGGRSPAQRTLDADGASRRWYASNVSACRRIRRVSPRRLASREAGLNRRSQRRFDAPEQQLVECLGWCQQPRVFLGRVFKVDATVSRSFYW